MLGLVVLAVGACGGGTRSDADGSDVNNALAEQGGANVAKSATGGDGTGSPSHRSASAAADGSQGGSAAASGSSLASAGRAASANASSPSAAAAAGSPQSGAPGAAVNGSAGPAGAAAGSGAATGTAVASGSAGPAGAAAGSGAGVATGTAATSGGTAAAAGSGASGPGATTGAAPSGAEPASCTGDQPGKAPVIYVIGDSTASVYEMSLYPRMGWAQPLQEYFKTACATVQDKALSGRSSKSFFDEGAWTPIRAALRAGDYVLIQFGHNDEKSDDATRYTEPFGSYQAQLSTYIDDTLAAKATPILLTSIERNKWSSGKLSATHGDYPEAVRQLAQKRQLTLVDMTQLTHEYLERIGQQAATKLFMNLAPGESPNYPNGNSDDTHLQDKGAHAVAEIALTDLVRQRTPLAALLDHVPNPP